MPVDRPYKINLDPATHIYTVNGKPKINPTTVLKDLGISEDYSNIDPEIIRHAAERGTATHLAILLHEQGNLDYDSVDPEVGPYFEAYLKFAADHQWRPMIEHCEVPLYDPILDFCTTLDAVGTLDGKLAIIDFKTSYKHNRAVEIQTGAQLIAWNDNVEEKLCVSSRYSLQLTKKASYKLRDHSDVAPQVWLSCLDLWRWLLRTDAV
jgi:hypothetical protein